MHCTRAQLLSLILGLRCTAELVNFCCTRLLDSVQQQQQMVSRPPRLSAAGSQWSPAASDSAVLSSEDALRCAGLLAALLTHPPGTITSQLQGELVDFFCEMYKCLRCVLRVLAGIPSSWEGGCSLLIHLQSKETSDMVLPEEVLQVGSVVFEDAED